MKGTVVDVRRDQRYGRSTVGQVSSGIPKFELTPSATRNLGDYHHIRPVSAFVLPREKYFEGNREDYMRIPILQEHISNPQLPFFLFKITSITLGD